MKTAMQNTIVRASKLFGIASVFAVLTHTAAFGACTGTSPNIVCNSGSGVTLTSTGAALHTAPSTGSPYPSNNVVSGLTGTISNIQVRFNNMSFDFSNDLDIALVSPSGTVYVLWSDVGIAGGYTNQTFTLADSASNALPCNTISPVNCGLPSTGTYRPANYAALVNNPDNFPGAGFTTSAANSPAPLGNQTLASRFNGENPNGTWKLYTSISAGPDNGSIGSWDLLFATQANNAATTTVITSSANPSIIPTSGTTTATLTATVTSGGNPVTLGAVTFFDNGTTTLAANVPLNSSGQASVTYNLGGSTAPLLTEGVHTISANYSGATGFGASNGQLTQTVDRATTVSGNTFCNTGSIAIPTVTSAGGNPYPSKLFVSSLGGVTQTVIMEIKGYTNPRSEDMNLLLVSPTGQKFIPFAYVSDITATSGANIRLDDASTNTLPNSGAIASGTYRPSYGLLSPNNTGFLTATFVSPAPAGPYGESAPKGTATFSSAFAGASPNGTWNLYTMNGAGGGGAGSIAGGWCLTFGTSSDPGTTTTPSVSPTPSALNQSVTISALVAQSSNGSPVNSQGTLTFKEGNTTLAGPLNVGSIGTASFAKSDFTQGAHFIDAFFSGVPGAFGLSNGQVLHYVDAATSNLGNGRFCNATSVTFPNNLSLQGGNPYPTRITTSGLAGVISKVTMELNGFSHQFPDDVDLMLTGPNGNSVIAMSDVGGSTAVTGLNLVLDSTAGSPLTDSAALSSGTFRPTDFEVGTDTFKVPAPTTNVFSASTTSFGTAFNNSNPNGIWTLWTAFDNAGVQGGGSFSSWCMNVTVTQPQLTISKTHSGNFTQGQTGAQYTVTVGSSGPGSTVGTITVVDTPPSGMTITNMTGNGWSCVVNTRTCTTTATLAANGTLPSITVTVDVAGNASSPQVNSVAVSGGGALGATANDSTIITQVPDLVISKTTNSTFVQSGTATYTLSVTNSGSGSSNGNYTISDPMPTGLTISGLPTGSGWDCSASTSTFVNCVRSTVLTSGATAPAVFVTVNIDPAAPSSITNTATVGGGGQINTGNDTSSVTSNVVAAAPDITIQKAVVSSAQIYQGAVFPEQLVYRLTIRNVGNAPSTGTITINDPVPTGLILRGITVSNGWSCSSTQPTTICSTSNPMAAPNGVAQINLTYDISPTAPLSITNTATVSGGGDTNPNNNTASVTNAVIERVPVTITVPAGVTFTFNGTTYTGPQLNILTPIGNRTLSVTSPQTTGGTRATWVSWSDNGAISHDIAVAANTPVSVTGAFSFEYQLTTAASPSNGGTVSPATGTFFAANTVVPVTATPNPGFTFTGWSGACTGTGACSVTMDAAKSVTANFTAQTAVTINVPAGISYAFNGQTVTGSQTFNVAPGTYVLSTTTPQSLGAGTQARFSNWSDSGAITHNVTVGSTALTITGTFITQFQLTTAASPSNGGTVSPVSGIFSDTGTVVTVTATPNSGFVFTGWSGACTGTGVCSVTMDAAKSVTANFTAQTGVTINVPAGVSYTFNGQTVTGSQTFNVAPGTYVLSTTTPQSLGAGIRAVFSSWSDSGAITHNVVVGSTPITITGNFTTEYQLTTTAVPSNGGTVSPASGFFPANTVVPVTATPNSGFAFAGWLGACSGSGSCSVTMDAPKSVTANFGALTGVTISVPNGVSYTFNGQAAIGTQSFQVAPGTYVLSTTSIQTLGPGIRAVFQSWSDSGAISHNVTVSSTALTITGNFTTQFQLTTAASPSNGGTVSPATGFFDSNSVVPVTATANSGFTFTSFSGACTGTGACSVTMDAPKSVTANFTAQTGVTINVPAGISYTFNGQTVTGSQTFNVAPGNYLLSTTTPQSLGAGSQAVFQSWSDSGAISHNVTVGSTALTITGTFKTQFQLTTAASPSNGGTISPASGFFDANSVVPVTATANSGFVFTGFSGACTGTGACSVTMNAAKSVTANFTAQTGVTINVPAGVSFTFNGQTVTGSQTFNVAPGTYLLSTTTPQSLGAGTQAVFNSWSDSGAISHNVVVGSTAIVITGSFTTQHLLTTAASPTNGGTITAGGFVNSGTVVNITALANSGFAFAGFSGACTGTGACSVTMDAPKSVTANFSVIPPAPDVTGQVTVTRGALAFNRATGRYSQIVTIQNNGTALTAAAYVLDNLAVGYTVFKLNTVIPVTTVVAPLGSPYLEVGPIAAGATATLTVEYTRVGTPALTYTPRVLGAGLR